MTDAISPAAIRDLLHDLRNPAPETLYGAVLFCREQVIPRLEAMLEDEGEETGTEGAAIAAEWREARKALDAMSGPASEMTAAIEDRYSEAERAVFAYRKLDCPEIARIQAKQCQEILTAEAKEAGRELDAIEQTLIANSFALINMIAKHARR